MRHAPDPVEEAALRLRAARGGGFAVALLWLSLAPGVAFAQQAAARPLPSAVLSARVSGEWQRWWDAAAAPDRWLRAHPGLAGAVEWERLGPGLERGELELAGDGLGLRFRVFLVRLDPGLHHLRLRQATRDYGLRGAWTLDSAAADAVLAVNAGQFDGGRPWGWLVSGGRELQPPGQGPLSTAVVLAGPAGVQLVSSLELPELRGQALEAFQSYPTLLEADGQVPAALQAVGRGVDLEHRDTRLALGLLRDGRLLLALTRFAAMGDVLPNLPVGPTTPEMAALMGALGCRRAVMLDGGLSSQMLLRGNRGLTELWPGLRRVPLALEAIPRGERAGAAPPGRGR